MSTNHYQLYLENTHKLAETLVIKSQASAEALNTYVRTYFGSAAVDDTDPSSWKYYRNIAGLYHPTDEPMTVRSLDTLETITFSRESLQVHRATARGYAYGTREYRQLVTRYPKQEMLILGILYPVDLPAAIAAPDGKILGWPEELVEVNEYSLIARLQRWVDGFRERWTNDQYAISDDLYEAAALGVMYLNLVPALLNLRLQACKTNEAHSFHVREYLASHGMLDQFLDQLTLRQALFLYRNIAYIERNSGQRNIFEWLVEHIMTERNLPIAEFVMRHNLSEQPAQIYPQVTFRKTAINAQQSLTGDEVQTLEEILLKEEPLARDNGIERQDHQVAIQQMLENSPSAVVKTKLLESAMWDYTNATPYTLADTLLHHWLWLSAEGLYYQAVVSITNPKTGERIPMMVKDAFAFMWYAFCASVGIKLETVPALYAKRVQRLPTPGVAELMEVVDPLVVPQSLAQDALAWQPTIYPMISTEAFYNKCLEIHAAANNQYKLIALQEHQARRGMVHAMVSRIYSDNICRVAPEGYLYENWFAERNIRIEDFNQEDLGAAYLSIMRDATGISLHNTQSVRNIQRAMIRLMSQLSSYTVQFLSSINDTDITLGNESSVRVGDRFFRHDHEFYVWDLGINAQQLYGQPLHTLHWDTGQAGIQEVVSQSLGQEISHPLPNLVHLSETAAVVTYARLDTAAVYVLADTQTAANDQGIVPVFGIEEFLIRTEEERATLKDVWRVYYENDNAAQGDLKLSGALALKILPGFVYTPPQQ